MDTQNGVDTEDRPLLADSDRLAGIKSLKASRQHLYALADWTIHTDILGAEDVVREIVPALGLLGIEPQHDPDRWQRWLARASLDVVHVGAASRDYDVLIDDALLPLAGMTLPEAGVKYKRVFVVTDSNVGQLTSIRSHGSLKEAGANVQTKVVPDR